METIKHLNEQNMMLQNNIVTKDATITTLEQALTDHSIVTTLPAEPSLVITVPSSDELDHNNGKVINLTRIPIISHSNEAEKIISEDVSFEKANRRRFKQKYDEETELKSPSSNYMLKLNRKRMTHLIEV